MTKLHPGCIEDTKTARSAIKKAPAVYVQIMMGDMTWAVKISKPEALRIIEQFEKDFQSLEDASLSGLGIIEGDGTVALGGL